MHFTLLLNIRSMFTLLRVTDTHVTVEPESGPVHGDIFGWGEQYFKAAV